MKRILMFLALGCITTGLLFATDPKHSQSFTQARLTVIERELVAALESDIPGLQISAARTMRQLRECAPWYEWNASVIPLMHIVNREEHDSQARVSAAIALHELRSSRGDFAIQRMGQFAANSKVQRTCYMLCRSRLTEE
ncbi:MAG: hypothetical protein WBD36_17195 [Bacteroidota bacterium]